MQAGIRHDDEGSNRKGVVSAACTATAPKLVLQPVAAKADTITKKAHTPQPQQPAAVAVPSQAKASVATAKQLAIAACAANKPQLQQQPYSLTAPNWLPQAGVSKQHAKMEREVRQWNHVVWC